MIPNVSDCYKKSQLYRYTITFFAVCVFQVILYLLLRAYLFLLLPLAWPLVGSIIVSGKLFAFFNYHCDLSSPLPTLLTGCLWIAIYLIGARISLSSNVGYKVYIGTVFAFSSMGAIWIFAHTNF